MNKEFDFVGTTVSEAAKVFEINSEGTVKIHGYPVDEAIKLLEGYRTHMIEFGRGMQALMPEPDAVTYRPENGFS